MLIEIAASTLIAEGTRLQGAVTFVSGTQVFGTVEGEIEQQSFEQLHIGKPGWINGTINAKGPVIVEGRVDGDIHSTTRIRLLPTAIVHGALYAPAVEIRAGAFFEGDLSMGMRKRETSESKAA